MKYYLLFFLVIAGHHSQAQPPFELSANVYRIPYSNTTIMSVSRDHFTHTSPNGDVTGRYDLVGSGQGSGCSIYRIVAAAPGIVRRVVDQHNITCDTCDNFNNYVWIEHANGEWTKYTHMKRFSASQDAGLVVDDTVCAGDFLGYECDIGHANGNHLHFEVRRPNNPANVVIMVGGGFMARADAAHVIPVINSISKHYFEDGDAWVASGSNSCTNGNVTVPAISMADSTIKIYMATSDISTNNNQVIFQNGANGMFHAGNSVTILPGFNATAGSFFHARIGGCSPTAFPGGCN